MAQIIAVANQKGGIGKTTTALALANCLERRGHHTLMVDMDPQANATDTYKAKIDDVATAYDLLINGAADCIQHTALGDIVAGDPLLKDATKQLDTVSASFKLREGLESIIAPYEYAVIDTPPDLSILLLNSLTVADKLVIPLSTDRYALRGLVDLYKTIQDVRKYTNQKLSIAGMLIIKYNKRVNLARELVEGLPEFEKMFGCKTFTTRIRECISTREAQAAREGLFEYAPKCTTAIDYEDFVTELMRGEN